jgi:hypothetical protein
VATKLYPSNRPVRSFAEERIAFFPASKQPKTYLAGRATKILDGQAASNKLCRAGSLNLL